MTIGELSKLSATPASTIRYYERIGVLSAPVRAGGLRRYSTRDVETLAVLRLAKDCGFRLDEMKHLLQGFGPEVSAPDRWRELARLKMDELNSHMNHILAMKQLLENLLKCGCQDLNECGRAAIRSRK
jgi:DNA-binding transcriptional MerR regulator